MSTPRQTRKRNASAAAAAASPSASTSTSTPKTKATPKAKATADPSSSKPDPTQLRTLALKTKKRKSAAADGAGHKKKKQAAVAAPPPEEEPLDTPASPASADQPDVDMEQGTSTSEQPQKVETILEETVVPEDSREEGELTDEEGGPPSSPPTPPLPSGDLSALGAIPTLVLPGPPLPTLLANGIVPPALPPHAFPPFPPPRPGSALSSSPSSHFAPPGSTDFRFPPPSPAFLEAVSAGPVKGAKGKKNKSKAGSMVIVQKAPERVDPVADGAAKLSVTEDAYAEMRTLLLELLSWGVPPSYLVKSGLTRDAVLVLFADLKIRLPTNLPGPAPIYEMHGSLVSPPPSSAPSSRPSSPINHPPVAPFATDHSHAFGPGTSSPASFVGLPYDAMASLPPPTLPGFGVAGPLGRPPAMAYPPLHHPRMSSGQDFPLPAPFTGAMPNFPPTLSRTGSFPGPPPSMPPFAPTLAVPIASSSSVFSPSAGVVSLISPVADSPIPLPVASTDSAALLSLEAQRRALLVARKKALEDKKKATEAAAALSSAKGKGREEDAPAEVDVLDDDSMEEGELDDPEAASLIEMELERIGLELAGGMMDGVEEEVSVKVEDTSDGLAEYDEDEQPQMFDPDGKVEDESNVLLAGLGNATASVPALAGDDSGGRSGSDSPVYGKISLSMLALPMLRSTDVDETSGGLNADAAAFEPSKKPSTSKRPVALDFDTKPTTTLPTTAPSTHQHRHRRALVPDRPKRFVIEVSDSETDSDDQDNLASAGPSTGRRVPALNLSSMSSSAPTPDPSRLSPASLSELDLEAKRKLELKEAEIRKMTQLIAAMEAKQKSRTAKSTLSTPTLTADTPVLVPNDALSAETGVPTLGLGHGSREGSVEALKGAVEQLQEVKERMEEERDEFIEDLVAAEDAGEAQAVVEEDEPALTVVADVDVKGKGKEKAPPAPTEAVAQAPALPNMTYVSPLAAYPSLQEAPTPGRPTRSKKKKGGKSAAPALTAAQLSTLRNSTIASRHLDPGRQLCRFEQAGGVCADKWCQDSHWRDLEPSDDDLANFLLGLFPKETLDSVKTIVRVARSYHEDLARTAQRAATLLHSR